MAVPVTALTLDQLVRKVAEKLSVVNYRTDGTPYLPNNDAFNLEKCVEMVNRGIQLFIDSAPKEGWQWMRRIATVTLAPAYTGTATAGAATSLTDGGIAGTYANDYFNTYVLWITGGTGKDEYATVTDYVGTTGQFLFAALSGGSTPDTTSTYRICRSTDVIDADPARYMLPADFGGQYTGKIGYAANTAHSTRIEWCDESVIRSLRATVVNSGYPCRAAIRPYQPTSSVIATGRRWEIIFDPQPTAADVVEFPYLLCFDGVQIIGGTADSGTNATTLVDATLVTLYPKDDVLNSMVAEILDGTGRGSYATVTDHAGASGTLTVADWLAPNGAAGGTDPTTASEFMLIPVKPYYHPCGFAYDGVIEAACLAACEIYGGDRVFDTHDTDLFFKVKLPQAHLINKRMVPRRLGQMTNGPRQVRERTWTDVTYN